MTGEVTEALAVDSTDLFDENTIGGAVDVDGTLRRQLPACVGSFEPEAQPRGAAGMANYDMMRTYLDLVVAGDFEGAMGYMSDDITVHMSGWKTIHGMDEYRAALAEIMEALGTIEVREHDLLVSDDHAVVLNSWHITSGERDEWLNNAVIYHTSDDKITELWVVSEDQEVIAELIA